VHPGDDSAHEFVSQYYATRLGDYDEMYAGGEGQLLPHWQPLMDELELLGPDGLRHRSLMAQRQLRENGVTFNFQEGPRASARPWQLDPIPLFISEDEWQSIEEGLLQRSELLNLILIDLYGQQRLLKEGLLPAELIYSHAGFLRPCFGMPFAGKRPLVLSSTNLARGPDGRMWVLDDRTQSPSGVGYALENRMVMTRIAPSLFKECNVKRLASFFQPLRDRLTQLAPAHREDPRIVFLTPGPYSQTYFEHAYLADYLGYTLVQGDDLSVRDGKVWLKSVDGLHQVDVILRRVDDSFCDPLELREDSHLGITGLLQAVRLGNVVVANPIGSGVLENPGMMPFMSAISKYFLGEDLKLPAVATWWCGQSRELDFVLKNLEKLVIKPIHRTRNYRAIFGAQLTSSELKTLAERIRQKPHLYIGQEMVSFSTAPAFVDGQVEPRHIVLRSFSVAGNDRYISMPGGLTRVSPQLGELVVSNRAGGGSKDAWVLSRENVNYVSLWRQAGNDQVIPFHSEPLPSRAADNLFWAGRYVERAEGSARLLRAVLLMRRDLHSASGTVPKPYLYCLLRALTHVTSTYPGFVGEGSEALLKAPAAELTSLLKDAERAGGLANVLQGLNQATLSVREHWPAETWRVIDAICQDWECPENLLDPLNNRMEDRLDHLIMQLVAFSGLSAESMSRGEGWLMLDMGRRLERALGLISLLRATLVTGMVDTVQRQLMETVLVICDSLNTYRRQYRSFMHLPTVLELILMDENHPRSLAYQLEQLQQHISALPRSKRAQHLDQDERCVFQAYSELRLADAVHLARVEERGGRQGLEGLLSRMAESLWKFSDVISLTYFSHSLPSHQLAPQHQDDEL